MNIDFNLISAAAEFTHNWKDWREDFAKFAKEEWEQRNIYQHMVSEYINTDTPLTLMIYKLDRVNKQLLLRYLAGRNHGLMPDIIDI